MIPNPSDVVRRLASENQLYLFMRRFCFFLFVIGLLAAGCDKIDQPPTPDPLQGLELEPLQIDLAGNGPMEIDLVGNTKFSSPVSFKIVRQPKNGTIQLNANSRFIYTPVPGFFGKDDAEYAICNLQNTCKSGIIQITVTDTTPPCQPIVGDYLLQVSSGLGQLLNLPDNFGCGTGITSLITDSGSVLSLTNGQVTGNFPSNQVDTTIFRIVSCIENRCDTGSVQVVSGLNECQALFKALPDTATMSSQFSAFNIKVSDLLKNDRACLNDLINNEIEIIQGPSNGNAVVRPPSRDGFLIRYQRNSPPVNDSFTYRVKSRSGMTSTTTVFIKIFP
jgi:hypothetical protein